MIGVDYPWPVVDPDTAISKARSNITEFRHRKGFVEESNRVYEKHGSRNPNRNGSVTPKRRSQKKRSDESIIETDTQQSLF